MASLNKVILIGRLTRDPELRYTASEVPVVSFSIAVDRLFKNAAGEKTTDFFRCTAWRQTAEYVNNYQKKGNLVAVEGRIELNSYTDRDGNKRYSTDIVCDQVQGLSSRSDQGGGGDDDQYGAPYTPPQPAAPKQRQQRRAPKAAPAPQPDDTEFDDFDDSDPFADE